MNKNSSSQRLARTYLFQAKEDLKHIFLLIDTGWITPAIKPEIMRALDKLEKVDVNSEVNYNAR